MTAAPNTKPPFLILDEFNSFGMDNCNIDDMDAFMWVCQERGFYLVIVTSKKDIADKLISLDAWQKILPLQSVHNGPILGQEEDKKPDWKGIVWSRHQLILVVQKHLGEGFANYDFITDGLTPKTALQKGREVLRIQAAADNDNTIADLCNRSDLSDDIQISNTGCNFFSKIISAWWCH